MTLKKRTYYYEVTAFQFWDADGAPQNRFQLYSTENQFGAPRRYSKEGAKQLVEALLTGIALLERLP